MSVNESLWTSPPGFPVLDNHEVHVWRANLDLSLSHVQVLEQTLAADEQQRSHQFRFPQDRTHYIVARGLLRAILGRYLATDPASLQFTYNEYGKPALLLSFPTDIARQQTGESGSDGLFFNLAHSHGMALYAITRGRNVGIDLEYIRLSADMEYEQIAERFFSPNEVSTLRALSPAIRREAFYCCWTRKEAYIKARGMGLSLDLQQFDVTVMPGEPAALLSTRGETQGNTRWWLLDLPTLPGYAAALAVEGEPRILRCWNWPP